MSYLVIVQGESSMCTGQLKTLKMVPYLSRCSARVCEVAPWLFNIYTDRILREAMEEFVGGVQLSNTKVQVLLLLMIF